ncbi:MAG: GspH/FimT family pseudopilin [Pseudomonadota bacterium]
MMRIRPNKGDAGFSMIEMLVVLAIVTLTIATASQAIIRRDTAPDPVDTASQVQSLAYSVRAQAMLTGVAGQLWVNLDNKTAGADGEDTIQIPADYSLDVVTARELIARDGRAIIVFLPDGGSSGAEITLSAENERSATLSIDWLTGLPVLERGEFRP